MYKYNNLDLLVSASNHDDGMDEVRYGGALRRCATQRGDKAEKEWAPGAPVMSADSQPLSTINKIRQRWPRRRWNHPTLGVAVRIIKDCILSFLTDSALHSQRLIRLSPFQGQQGQKDTLIRLTRMWRVDVRGQAVELLVLSSLRPVYRYLQFIKLSRHLEETVCSLPSRGEDSIASNRFLTLGKHRPFTASLKFFTCLSQ
jgi:hypothetical protein